MKNSLEIVYAFIDSQNLNLGTISDGWRLDYGKFRLFLRNKYNVQKVFLFIGYIPTNETLYKQLEKFGYELVFKPVNHIRGKIKGNVDAELVLYAVDLKESYDKGILVSGDGDFFCLVDYWFKRNQLEKIITPNSKYSSLLRRYGNKIVNLSLSKSHLEYKRRHSRGKQC